MSSRHAARRTHESSRVASRAGGTSLPGRSTHAHVELSSERPLLGSYMIVTGLFFFSHVARTPASLCTRVVLHYRPKLKQPVPSLESRVAPPFARRYDIPAGARRAGRRVWWISRLGGGDVQFLREGARYATVRYA
ncbi:uncharacterized protein K452DRAFT_141346 [Aplosporella prunicola CBS 121167]|uniref:Uncharacterized protein n=1 Tax=Aplosporella prunicola CBS 121167 TaxID=1176127 RepID=A0A6A6BJV3_9PEZI|nr:uncharacterized protein K452DRAFT_141346 [Aplosporella prunicola CBS 121167]KAF2144399.1 hypothetical protein K452DRAFT_141346 [Aplosporella prunicola CBS 121167]